MRDSPFLRRFGLALLTASVPVIVTLLLLTLQGYRWQDHVPAMGDEINYWHQAGTWDAAKLNGGYYVIDNVTARAPFAHYYAWGFGPPFVYGTFADLFGWPLSGAMTVNALMIFVAAVGFVLLARLEARQCAWFAALLAVYPPLIAYLPSSMLEPIYMAGMLLIAGGLYRLQQGERDRWLIVFTGILLVGMSLMRFTWALIFWPYLYHLQTWRFWTLRSRPAESEPKESESSTTGTPSRLKGRDLTAPMRGENWGLKSFVMTGVLAVIFFVIYSWTSSPYVYALNLMIGMIPTEPMMAFLYYINMVADNVLAFLFPHHVPSIALRFVFAGVLIWSFLQRNRARTRVQRESMTLLLYILGGALLLACLVYTTRNSIAFRFFSPYLLMALALCIAWNHLGLIRIVIAIFAVTLPLAFIGTDSMRDRAFDPARPAQVAAYQQEWADLGVVYIPDADPWCNTFAYSLYYLEDPANQDRLVALDPGMGISMVWWKPQEAQRAQYLMLTDEDYEFYPQPELLTRLLDVPGGAVYRNTVRECPLP